MLGDCIERMKEIPDCSVDMVLCDLPYGLTQCGWDKQIPFSDMWFAIHRVIKTNASVCLFGMEPFSSKLRCSNLKEYKYDWIWDKVRPSGFLNAKRQPLRCHEIISVFYSGQCTYNPQKTQGHPRKVSSAKSKECCKKSEAYGQHGLVSYDSTERYPKSIQTFSLDIQKSALHTTQKPVALLEYLIKTYTNENDTVLDFTMGSGSTGVAAANTGRNFIGIELDAHYFEIAQKRIGDAEKAQVNMMELLREQPETAQMGMFVEG